MRVKKLVGVFTALAIALMTAVIAIPSASASAADQQFADRLYVLINDYRQQHSLAPLRVNAQMAADSQAWTQHSADIANTGGAQTFDHSPGSHSFYENIVWNMSADAAFNSWAQSPPHRANMLKAGATDFGIGAVQLTAGPNKGTFLATAKFGSSGLSPEQEAALREAERLNREKVAADEAAEKAAAAERAEAAERDAAAVRAAEQAAAEKAAADAAAKQAAADAAAKAAADKAAADAAAKAAADAAAAAPGGTQDAADKAAQEAAAQQAAEKAAAEAAAKAAADKAAQEEAERTAAAQAAAEQAARDEAARSAAPTEAVPTEAVPAAVTEAEAEAEAKAAAEQEAAAQAAAEQAAADQARADAVAAEQANAKARPAAATAAVSLIDQVVLGDASALTPAAQGAVTAKATGSQLSISGLEAGAVFEPVVPSAAVNLGAMTADASGSIKLSVPPVLAAGEHKVALFKGDALTGWATFSVEPAVTVLAAESVPASADGSVELAATGLNTAQMAIGGIGALMALIGAVALVAVQRQRGLSAR